MATHKQTYLGSEPEDYQVEQPHHRLENLFFRFVLICPIISCTKTGCVYSYEPLY